MSALPHTFHMPVMGTGFTIDTPLHVARFGISSVISLVDDDLIEDMRQACAAEHGESYEPIAKKSEDWRAHRITAYLNLLDTIVQKQVARLKQTAFEAGSEITHYFELLPDASPLRSLYRKMLATSEPAERSKLENELREAVTPGQINANIMTKLDRTYYDEDLEPLGEEYSDALAALRGFAQSTIQGGIVLSAGFNRRLYSYIEQFSDFYADAAGTVKKEIILKVSDARSAITQGKFFAKKGLWVSEYRIESGLNCGGHAFAGSGNLMGPVLEEFRKGRQAISEQIAGLCREALKLRDKVVPAAFKPFRVTAQGGIGTVHEDRFLKTHYALDSTGWGSPFLLVPEATQVDVETLNKLTRAKEKDLYLSDVSPLGVPFHTLKTSPSELNKRALVEAGQPGSPCPRGHLVSNTEFTTQPICTASRQYQRIKISRLKKEGLSEDELAQRTAKVTAKACICHELGHSAYVKKKIKTTEPLFPAICPGPNIAYFNKIVSLKDMIDHIYGRANILPNAPRPHMFIKELRLNIQELEKLIARDPLGTDAKIASEIAEYEKNLREGIDYYRALIPAMTEESNEAQARILTDLAECETLLLETAKR